MDIVLVSVGKVPPGILEQLKDDLTPILEKSVQVGNGLPEPDYAYNAARKQFLSTAILKILLKEKGRMPFRRILGLVDHDLYVPELNFVFGEASSQGAIIALVRLRESYYGNLENPSLFQKRVLIEAVHELGHTYSLNHCPNPTCVMFFSNCLADTDRKGRGFCPKCRKRYDSFQRSG